MTNRRHIREKVFQCLYAWELSRDPIQDIIKIRLESLRKDKSGYQFAEKLINSYTESEELLDNIVKKHLRNWELNRVAVIDKIIIRMAMCEMIYFDDIPPKVSINEAVDIAKRYSTDKSSNFVNGILDAVYNGLKEKSE